MEPTSGLLTTTANMGMDGNVFAEMQPPKRLKNKVEQKHLLGRKSRDDVCVFWYNFKSKTFYLQESPSMAISFYFL